MAANLTIRVEGFAELQAALRDLAKATQRNVVRKAVVEALGPMKNAAEGKAPRATGELAGSFAIVPARAAYEAGSRTRRVKSEGVSMNMGPTADNKMDEAVARFQERGTVQHPPHAYQRPAFDEEADGALVSVKEAMKIQIDKATARAARKAARLLAKAG